MNNNKLIDILLLTHNRVEDTIKCVSSILNSTPNVFSLIIVDNGSEDDTPDYLNSLEKNKNDIRVILNSTNLGIIKGRNLAYSIASESKDKAKFTMFLDNDQFVFDGWLESYLYYLDGYDVVGFEGWEMRNDFYPIKKAIHRKDPFHYVGCGGMVVNDRVIKDIGLFDDNFSPMFYEDPDFCFRALDHGYTICWNYDRKIIHKPHKLLGSNNEKLRYFYNSWEYFKKKYNGHILKDLSTSL